MSRIGRIVFHQRLVVIIGKAEGNGIRYVIAQQTAGFLKDDGVVAIYNPVETEIGIDAILIPGLCIPGSPATIDGFGDIKTHFGVAEQQSRFAGQGLVITVTSEQGIDIGGITVYARCHGA